MIFKKMSIFLLFLLLISTLSFSKVHAGYSYSYNGWPIHSTEPYMLKTAIVEHDIGVPIGTIVDVFVYENEIYILDKELSKFIILDHNYNLVKEFPSSDPESNVFPEKIPKKLRLDNPNGIFVNEDKIYIADTGNNRILVLNKDNYFMKSEVIEAPDDQVFDSIEFSPLKVSVDASDRLYVIAQDVFEGIIELNEDGSFSRYTGVNKVAVSEIDIFWMKFMSEEQKSKMSMYLPTTFVNFEINEKGFLYTVSRPDDTYSGIGMVQKINPKGVDVLKRNGYFDIKGDLVYPWYSTDVPLGASSFESITINEYGLYSILDTKRGRIFTYDYEGNLLYIFGEVGNQETSFENPVAIKYINDNILVADAAKKSIMIYQPTEFGTLVNEASKVYYNGDYEEAAVIWEKVFQFNTNYYLAYRGIGKAQMRQGNYKEAMKNFKLSNDKLNYSIAFKEYRNDVIEKIFPVLMSIVLVGIGYVFYTSIKSNIEQSKELGRD